jgi:heat shock protein HslJ
MNILQSTSCALALATAGLLGACSSSGSGSFLNPFTKIDGTDPSVLAKMSGSWTVINTGGTQIENMDPPAVVVFNTADSSVSGFDGCNNFNGTYSFTEGRLKANVASTRRACTTDMARTVSTRLNALFGEGAEVVETSFMAANVLMLRNDNGDVRMGPTDKLKSE